MSDLREVHINVKVEGLTPDQHFVMQYAIHERIEEVLEFFGYKKGGEIEWQN